jgi:hypothetical protein
MKIAVSGSAGTGKTSLATAIATKGGYSIVDENYDEFFEDDYQFVQPASRLQRRILDTLERKNEFENEYRSFVADRCPVDLFNLWLGRGFGNNQRKTTDLYNRCRSYICKYDVIVVLPWSALPLVQVDRDDGPRRRVLNPWSQLYNHSTMIGLLQQWVPPNRLLPVPFNIVDIQARVDFITRSISEK